MIRVPFLLGLVLLVACENPAAPGTAVPDAGPLPSRKIVAASAVTDLGKPPNAKTAHAFDVNDAGGVAGYSVNNGGRARGFVWRASSGFTVLSPLSGHRDAFAFSINDNNQVVGISQTSAGLSQATMWTNGSPASLGSLVPGGASFGMAVNYWGSVAGSATIAGGATHAFYYSFLTRRMTDIGVLTGGTYSMGQDLNDLGQVVGYGDTPAGDRAFIYNSVSGALNELGTIPGGTSSYALSVNNSAQVVGFAFASSGFPHAFLWQGGTMTDLGTLGGPQSVAFGINDTGEVVGYSQVAGGEFHAFVWTAQSGMVDLGTLPGGVISYAQQINPSGLTAGIAQGSDGLERAVRWSVTLQ